MLINLKELTEEIILKLLLIFLVIFLSNYLRQIETEMASCANQKELMT